MSFNLRSVVVNGATVKLTAQDPQLTEKDTNNLTIITGNNGTGKSRFLSQICQSMIFLDSEVYKVSGFHGYKEFDLQNFEVAYSLGGKPYKIGFSRGRFVAGEVLSEQVIPSDNLPRPARVIATTITPFDKFPVNYAPYRANAFKKLHRSANNIYRYMGSKNRNGQISAALQISRIIESLMFATTKSVVDLLKLKSVFELLGYSGRVLVSYRMNVTEKDLRLDMPNQRYLFDEDYYLSLSTKEGNRFRRSPEFVKSLRSSIKFVHQHFRNSNNRNISMVLDFSGDLNILNDTEVFAHLEFLRVFGYLNIVNVKLQRMVNSREWISIVDASSGEQGLVLTFLAIASEIQNDSLIVIDEPEISLHPEWQEKFVPLLRKTFAGYRGCHFILATHSPQVISNAGENCSILSMDDGSIKESTFFSKKSADFQLAELFDAPGYRNEYLAKEAMSALKLIGGGKIQSEEFSVKFAILMNARPHLHGDDPVAQIIDVIAEARRGQA